MKHLIFLFMLAFAMSAQAQTQTIKISPFKHLPVPQLKMAQLNEVTAYRFVLPFAGFSPITRQMSTGLGYGWNKFHFNGTVYYTDLSIFAAIFINGNIDPTPYNFTSVGAGVGILNDLIMIVPSYNLPTAERKGGAFDLKISFGLTFK